MRQLVWYIPSGLLAVLLSLMLKNRAYKVCPWFFAYVVFGMAADSAKFVARYHLHSYLATYWIAEAGYCLLGIAAMYEAFGAVLRGLADAWWSRLIFPAVLAAGIGLSLARAHASPPQFSGIAYYIVVAEIAVRLVQVFSLTLTLMPLVGFPGRRYAIGVASGFGVYSTVALLMTMKFSDIGKRFAFSYSVTLVATYSVAVLVWIWCFRRPQKDEASPYEEQAPSAPGSQREHSDRLRRLRLPSLARLADGLFR